MGTNGSLLHPIGRPENTNLLFTSVIFISVACLTQGRDISITHVWQFHNWRTSCCTLTHTFWNASLCTFSRYFCSLFVSSSLLCHAAGSRTYLGLQDGWYFASQEKKSNPLILRGSFSSLGCSASAKTFLQLSLPIENVNSVVQELHSFTAFVPSLLQNMQSGLKIIPSIDSWKHSERLCFPVFASTSEDDTILSRFLVNFW